MSRMERVQALHKYLHAIPQLAEPLTRVPVPVDDIDLRTPAALHLLDGGFTVEPFPFETLHERLRDHLTLGDAELGRTLSARIAGSPAELGEAYRELIAFIARDVLGFDVVFEAQPVLRFHPPGPMMDRYRCHADGGMLAFHSDLMLGDRFEQLNCWLPLTTSTRSNGLQHLPLESSIGVLEQFIALEQLDIFSLPSSREQFFRCLDTDDELRALVRDNVRSLETDYGGLWVFDPRIIHGTAENREQTTRVSIDFRLLPKDAYDRHRADVAQGDETECFFGGVPMLRGHFYDGRTAFAL